MSFTNIFIKFLFLRPVSLKEYRNVKRIEHVCVNIPGDFSNQIQLHSAVTNFILNYSAMKELLNRYDIAIKSIKKEGNNAHIAVVLKDKVLEDSELDVRLKGNRAKLDLFFPLVDDQHFISINQRALKNSFYSKFISPRLLMMSYAYIAGSNVLPYQITPDLEKNSLRFKPVEPIEIDIDVPKLSFLSDEEIEKLSISHDSDKFQFIPNLLLAKKTYTAFPDFWLFSSSELSRLIKLHSFKLEKNVHLMPQSMYIDKGILHVKALPFIHLQSLEEDPEDLKDAIPQFRHLIKSKRAYALHTDIDLINRLLKQGKISIKGEVTKTALVAKAFPLIHDIFWRSDIRDFDFSLLSFNNKYNLSHRGNDSMLVYLVLKVGKIVGLFAQTNLQYLNQYINAESKKDSYLDSIRKAYEKYIEDEIQLLKYNILNCYSEWIDSSYRMHYIQLGFLLPRKSNHSVITDSFNTVDLKLKRVGIEGGSLEDKRSTYVPYGVNYCIYDLPNKILYNNLTGIYHEDDILFLTNYSSQQRQFIFDENIRAGAQYSSLFHNILCKHDTDKNKSTIHTKATHQMEIAKLLSLRLTNLYIGLDKNKRGLYQVFEGGFNFPLSDSLTLVSKAYHSVRGENLREIEFDDMVAKPISLKSLNHQYAPLNAFFKASNNYLFGIGLSHRYPFNFKPRFNLAEDSSSQNVITDAVSDMALRALSDNLELGIESNLILSFYKPVFSPIDSKAVSIDSGLYLTGYNRKINLGLRLDIEMKEEDIEYNAAGYLSYNNVVFFKLDDKLNIDISKEALKHLTGLRDDVIQKYALPAIDGAVTPNLMAAII